MNHKCDTKTLPTICGYSLVLLCAFVATPVYAVTVMTEPFLGVRLFHQTETSPRPLNIYVAEIDLAAPGLSFQVTPLGPDPRPTGTNPGFSGQPMETIRQTTRQYANAIGAQIAINASYFSAQEFYGVFWANNLGLTASNGIGSIWPNFKAYSGWETGVNNDNNFDDALNITQTNQAQFVKMPSSIPNGDETLPAVSLYNTVTGKHRLLQSNQVPITLPSDSPNARTAVGLTVNNAKLLLMTVDDTQPGISEGLSLIELANWMKNYYGAVNAINLDGGGSTTMVANFYNDASTAQVLNIPSDGGERSVGTNLAVFALPNGDYNQNGNLDAADYVVWRNSIGGQVAYDVWRSKFGSPAGSGGGFTADTASIPEPTAFVFIAWAISTFAVSRWRRNVA